MVEKITTGFILFVFFIAIASVTHVHAYPITIHPGSYDGSLGVHVYETDDSGPPPWIMDVTKDWSKFHSIGCGSFYLKITFDNLTDYLSVSYLGIGDWLHHQKLNCPNMRIYDINNNLIGDTNGDDWVSKDETTRVAYKSNSYNISYVKLWELGTDGEGSFGDITFDSNPVPEPSTILLIVAGLACAGFLRRHCRG